METHVVICVHREKLCEDTVRRQQHTSQGERPQKKPSLDPGPLASGIQRKMIFVVKATQAVVFNISLWQP